MLRRVQQEAHSRFSTCTQSHVYVGARTPTLMRGLTHGIPAPMNERGEDVELGVGWVARGKTINGEMTGKKGPMQADVP
jgi:hypothetical protein